MMQLHHDREKFAQRQIDIIVICPDKKHKIEAFAKKNGIELTFVADEEHKIAQEYGQEVALLKLGRMPMQILIDGTQIIFQHSSSSMMDIVENDKILEQWSL